MAVYRRESRRRPVIALIVVTCLALIALDNNGNGVIASIRHNARDAIAPVQGLVEDAFDPVTDVFDGVTKVDNLEEENAALRSRVAELESRRSRDRGLADEYDQLAALLDIPNIEDATGVAARVIGGPAANFERSVTLNKGTSKGIAVGMPIVAGNVLVGKVVDASRTRATVALIDGPDAGVGVRLERSREQALTEGRSGDKLMRLGFLSNPRADVDERELVFTVGSEAYPPDVPVGRVVKIDLQRGELDPDIFVEPLVDLDKLVFVKALRWPPSNADAPTETSGNGN